MTPFNLFIPVGLLLVGLFVLLGSSLIRQRRQDIELRASEARYRSFFDNSPISLWEEDFSEVKAYIERLRKSGVKDFKRYFSNHHGEVSACAGMVKILDINKATLRMFDAESKEDFFSGLTVVFGDEIHEAFIDELTAIASNAIAFEAMDFNRTVTGERKEILLNWSVVPGHEMDYSKVLISIIDVTAQKLADQALRDSEKRYRDLVENISEIYFVCDDLGAVVYASPNFFSATGYAIDEIIGKTFLRLVAPEDRVRVLEFYRARSNDGTLDTSCEFRGKAKDGRVTWVEQSTRIVRHEGGQVKEFRNVVRNITERIVARDKLALREKRFRVLIEESSDVVCLVDKDGTISYISPAITKILGYQPEELIGRSALEYIHEFDLGSMRTRLEELMVDPSKAVTAEVRYREKGGTWRWIEGIGKNLLDDPAVNAIVVNFRDVTDRRAAEELLRELPIRIINAQESERRRVARDLHDSVNQILSSVKFRMESIEERTNRKDKVLKGVVASAKHSLENAINEVRRISQNLRPSELDDLGVIPAVRSMCEGFKGATKIKVDLKFSRFPKKLSPEIEVTIYRIIQEALSNVAKHSQATRLTVRCAGRKSFLTILIEDNGKGWRQHEGQPMTSKSSGMGILNMKERAAFVGGTVAVQSTPKKGMALTIQIPY